MAETEASQKNLAALRTDVEQIRTMQRFQIAANSSYKEFVQNHLNDMKGAAEVYLALAAGPQNLEGLMKVLGKSKPQVSKICTHLHEQGFIARVPDPAKRSGLLFVWTDLETLLGVSSIAKRLVNGKKKAN